MGAGDLGRGIDILLSIGGVEVGGQRNCDFSGDADLIDASHKSSGAFKRYLMGNRGGQIELDSVHVENDAAQAALESAWINGTTVTASMAMPDARTISGSCYVQNLRITSPHTEVASYAMTLIFDNTITYA